VALQQADQAIRKDVFRALVEVITNCNDSYSRLEQAGWSVGGEIIIEVQRKHKNSVIRIFDHAEGMTDSRMDKVVGTYGEATSGIKEDKHVRGMWGRGLKDSIFGLGHGYVRSFKV
jgi:HSP90 family molecular chaperone